MIFKNLRQKRFLNKEPIYKLIKYCLDHTSSFSTSTKNKNKKPFVHDTFLFICYSLFINKPPQHVTMLVIYNVIHKIDVMFYNFIQIKGCVRCYKLDMRTELKALKLSYNTI